MKSDTDSPNSSPNSSADHRSPLWPAFWSHVPEEDRAALRDVLAELLGRGVILGGEGSGRELFLLVRDNYRAEVADYLAPLGLDLIVDDEGPLLQARPRTEACQLLGSFTRDETLVLLTLWRVWDDAQVSGVPGAVVLTVDELWSKLRVFFDRIDPPEKTQMENILVKLRRHRLVRTLKPEGIPQPGEVRIEVLSSLARVIPFDDLEAWLQRADLCQPESETGEPNSANGQVEAAEEEESGTLPDGNSDGETASAAIGSPPVPQKSEDS